MKYGVLGDVHSNLSALEEALAEMDRRGVDVVVSVGDVVGYGAAPSETIQLLRDRNVWVVKGNHDAACVGDEDDRYFNRYAREAVRWTRSTLGGDELDWLRALPMTLELEHCHVAHGTLDSPEAYEYTLGVQNARPSIDHMSKQVCFVGHSHIPVTILLPSESPTRVALAPDPFLDLTEAHRAIVNVGSVGQPRDEDPRLAMGIYDVDAATIEIVRREYDIEREAARIRAAGLPNVLADRLWLGL
ncbi:metallophosphoesterase family protein [Engelhardtia mirabilis]|uniref:Phosphodiesterase n=1 Tax=Engelhardtia mirabilis TaxID=2528011 RepID=A0A518BT14_9BACT|nr:phosphodiesterase [Planctomycetes bacterium Pla133]QDV04438.1 phosphodiesterase [Planctomycetes bacterium Pla86]